MSDNGHRHCTRPWWRRPPVWVLGALAILLAVYALAELTRAPAALPYSAFLQQLDAGNVASVTFNGTEIDGRFKHSPANAPPDANFRSRVPAMGDPTLMPGLRAQHVQIGVASSQWMGTGTAAVFGVIGAALLAKPMLLVIGVAFVAGLIRVARGGTMDMHSILSTLPMFRSAPGQVGAPQQGVGSPHAESGPLPLARGAAGAPQFRRKRPWSLRMPVWIVGVIVLGLVAFGVMEMTNRPPAISYGNFLDQLDADNIASVTLAGTQIDGTFKHAVGQATAKGTASQVIFRTQGPDFGDPTLVPELRKERVVIDVVASSNWIGWLGRLPWPMVVLLVAVAIGGLVRLARGKEPGSGSAMPMHPMQGMMHLLAGRFGKSTQDEEPTGPPGAGPKTQ